MSRLQADKQNNHSLNCNFSQCPFSLVIIPLVCRLALPLMCRLNTVNCISSSSSSIIPQIHSRVTQAPQIIFKSKLLNIFISCYSLFSKCPPQNLPILKLTYLTSHLVQHCTVVRPILAENICWNAFGNKTKLTRTCLAPTFVAAGPILCAISLSNLRVRTDMRQRQHFKLPFLRLCSVSAALHARVRFPERLRGGLVFKKPVVWFQPGIVLPCVVQGQLSSACLYTFAVCDVLVVKCHRHKLISQDGSCISFPPELHYIHVHTGSIDTTFSFLPYSYACLHLCVCSCSSSLPSNSWLACPPTTRCQFWQLVYIDLPLISQS